MNENITARQSAYELEQALINAQTVIDKSYLEHLTDLTVAPPNSEITDINVKECGTFFRIERLVTNKEENFLDKLVTVANAVSPIGCSLTTVVESDGELIKYYIGVIAKNARMDNNKDTALRKAGKETFSGAIAGNFSGSTLLELSGEDTKKLQENLSNCGKSVAAVSGIVSLRNKEERDSGAYVQGLENLTNSLKGKKYTIVMIADPVSSEQIRESKLGYEMLYSQLSMFKGFSLTVNESESLTLSESRTTGITKGISEGITRSQSYGTSTSHSKGSNFGTNTGISGGFLGFINVSGGKSRGTNENDTAGTSSSNAVANATTLNRGENESNTKNAGHGTTQGKSLQINTENRSVKSLMDKIDLYIERLNACENYGAFECAVYVLTDSREDAMSAAGHYNAIMRGDDSFVQSSHVNVWPPKERLTLSSRNSSANAEQIIPYLKAFSHPEFYLNQERGNAKVRPSSLISGKELAIQFALPKKSVHGLTVMEMTPFGRNVPPVDGRKVNLGTLYYMGREESANTLVPLNVDSLSSHTFITGSTGSGKSNTLYHMLSELRKHHSNVKFMVVEPAKGEYKDIFGQFSDVAVYGTNPKKTKLLRINPFSFPRDVHVLEHLDRLVELFNVCWPMYAAMPAILKKSMERAYEAAGWNLQTSTPQYDGLVPVFADVLEQIRIALNESSYSDELKGNYIGSLETRVESLTNGINGMIFCGDALSDEELFDSNVIVDLSLVGSVETKSLIMGLLVMKLQEHRAATAAVRNAPLKHITVLEEAHNLLKRTSTEQSSESSNLLGKSVELLANSIAEMRTYGEGFIIADQSPGLLDMSVIRNTNTKIILRLPEFSDRELVGKSIGLTDEQIVELSKFERGVAAVYQNDWAEPILVKIVRNDLKETPYKYKPDTSSDARNAKMRLIDFLIQGRFNERTEFDAVLLESDISRANVSVRNKILLKNMVEECSVSGKSELWTDKKFRQLSVLVADLLNIRAAVENEVLAATDNEELTNRLADIIRRVYTSANDNDTLAISQCLMKDLSVGRAKSEIHEKIYRQWFASVTEGGIRL